ncbi:MAG: MoaD/ThiS family protein, partial [Deltaproteobacteria bacterium]|nr:MoaD/ThiS family protein [Deltaproteobacteria bacterium]
MKITLRSTFAVGGTTGAERASKGGAQTVDLEEGATVRDLLWALPSLGPSEQWDDIMIHVFVNGELKGYDYPLRNGDVVDLHIPVSGG